MADTEYYIKPHLRPKQAAENHQQDDIDDEVDNESKSNKKNGKNGKYGKDKKNGKNGKNKGDEKDKSDKGDKEKNILSKNKYLVITFAIIVILLLMAVLYLYFKDDKKVKTEIPANNAKTKQPDVPKQETQSRVQDNQNREVQAPKPQIPAPELPLPMPKAKAKPPVQEEMTHETVVNTVDDNELNEYIHLGKENKDKE
jgi:hypothetical protein